MGAEWPDLKRTAFGSLRLRPDEFWDMTLSELAELTHAFFEEEKRQNEDRIWLAAWQTSHVMNSTGNYKHPVTVDKLLGKKPNGDTTKQRFDSPDEKKKALEELKSKFAR